MHHDRLSVIDRFLSRTSIDDDERAIIEKAISVQAHKDHGSSRSEKGDAGPAGPIGPKGDHKQINTAPNIGKTITAIQSMRPDRLKIPVPNQINCSQHSETTVMDAVKNVLGFEK